MARRVASPLTSIRLTISSGSSLNKVNSLCDSLRDLLEIDLVKYVETILTTHVSKQPPDYEAGLRVLLKLQGLFHHPFLLLMLTW